MKILYKDSNDTAEFDKERWLKSLRSYGEIRENEVERVIKEKIECYPTPHVSVLVREGVRLFVRDEDAEKYYNDHPVGTQGFLRLVRVTGYLTGDYRKANDGKLHEFAERTVNGLSNKNGVYTREEKNLRAAMKLAYPAISKEITVS